MKTLTFVPIGGLANRFYAITSAIAFCQDYNIKLRVIWFKDKGMGADFHSLFKLSENVDKSNVEVIDAKWYHYIYDRPRKRNLWLPCILQIFFFRKRSYEKDIDSFNIDSILNPLLKGKRVYLVHYGRFCSQINMKALALNGNIKLKANEIISSFPRKNKVIGVHIRRTDNIVSIQKSPLYLFVEALDKEIEIDPLICFYVASDSLKEKKILKERYKERVFMLEEEAQRSNTIGIENALLELYLLSQTKKIYGSVYSSFSTLASELSRIPLHILSVENN